MKNRILKYEMPFPLEAGDITEINLPKDYGICDINHQNGKIYLWVNCDERAPTTKLKFVIYGTGWEIEDLEDLSFLKTIHMPDGIVWHVFSVLK